LIGLVATPKNDDDKSALLHAVNPISRTVVNAHLRQTGTDRLRISEVSSFDESIDAADNNAAGLPITGVVQPLDELVRPRTSTDMTIGIAQDTFCQ
jgi:hypothetical protein